ncbi:MAG: S8 family serine peptidase [Solirubrobacterales bacterium]
MSRPLLPIAIAALALLLAAPAASALEERPALPKGAPTTQRTAFSTVRVIVEWAPAASRRARVGAREDAGVAFGRDLGSRRFQLVEVEPGQTAASAVRELEADPAVAVAERDGYSTPAAIPDDPLLGELWGLRNLGTDVGGFVGALAGADVNAVDAWSRSVGGPTTVIADIDSGYRFEHPDLAGVVWTNPDEVAGNAIDDDANGYVDDVHGYDFVGADGEAPVPDQDPTDDDLISGGHGVHTAGTIGAQGNNGIGITGVAQDARIVPLRVCSRFDLQEESLCWFSSQVEAIEYAGANGARVANISLTSTFNSAMVGDAIAANPQTLFVISAGNDGEDNDVEPHYPCNYDPVAEGKSAVDNVICVAATDQADELAGFSNWGSSSVDLGAPGTEILSTYLLRRLVDESFEAEDFGSKWFATGAEGGFARTNEAPLSSFGMSDSPGAAPEAGSTRASTSAAVPLPAGFESCTLEQSRALSLGGGTYSYDILLDGFPVGTVTVGSSGSGRFPVALDDRLADGGDVSLRFRYTAGGAPSADNGVWLDDIDLYCPEPVGQASGYEFLQGTSMAAPHVSGAAGLLFSLEPAATVTEVKDALLAGVDPDPALAGVTTSGGRLDIPQAMDALEAGMVDSEPPEAPLLTATDPPSPAAESHPRIFGLAEPGTSVSIFEGPACGGAPRVGGTAEQLELLGLAVTVPASSTRQFSATATDAAENTSPCSAPISYTNTTASTTPMEPGFSSVIVIIPDEPRPPAPPVPQPGCAVPRLAGKTLGKAKLALVAAGCRVGKVSKPKARKGQRPSLPVVKSSAPPAGSRAAGGVVALTLGPKPKKRHH